MEHSQITPTAGPPPDQDSLRIRLLGGFAVAWGERRVDETSWRFTNAKRLVQLLALAQGRRMHREQIADLLWPHLDGGSATNNFHQVLHHARRALLSIQPEGWDDGSILLLKRQILSLNPAAPLSIDVDAFEQTARDARQHDRPGLYADAIALYTGDLLPDDPYEDWLSAPREALRQTCLDLLLGLADLGERLGDLAESERALTEITSREPAHETAHAALMRLFAVTGRRHQALRQFRLLEAALRRDLDAEPDAETRALHERIMSGELEGPPPTHSPRPPDATSGEQPPLIGRDRETRLMQRAVEDGLSGRGRVLGLAGEPGIGKTRLAEETVSFARERGAWTLWGRCHEGEGAPAYWPWVQIIRAYLERVAPDVLRHDLGSAAPAIAQVVPEVGERLPGLPAPDAHDSDRARFRFFDGVARFLRNVALRSPLVLVIDDLHWADESSLALLAFVAREIGDSRIVIIGTFRDTEAGADGRLSKPLDDLSGNPLLQRHDLSGLTEENVRRMIAEATQAEPDERVASAIHQRTGGNPFFVGEVVRLLLAEGRLSGAGSGEAAGAPIPPGVKGVIGHRVRRLGSACGEMLAAASVIGREFALGILEPVTALDRIALLDGLDEAMRAGMIERLPGSTGRFRFRHALIQESLYEDVPSARRAVLHQQVGECLEHLHAGDLGPFLTEIAHHFYQAMLAGAGAERAIEYAIRAGDLTLRQFAYAEAADHYRRALDTLDLDGVADGALRCDVLLKLGDAHNFAGQYHDAQQIFQRASAAARERQLPEHLARAALGAAGLGIIVHTLPEHIRFMEEAVAGLPTTDSPLRARLLVRLALALIEQGTIERRRALCSEAEAIARKVDDPATLQYVLIAANNAIWTPDNLDERRAAASEIVALSEQSGDAVLRPSAFAFRIKLLMELGDIPELDDDLQRFAELARELGQPQRQWFATDYKTMRAFMDGRLRDAEALANEAWTIGEPATPALAAEHHFVQLLCLCREQGRVDELSAAADAFEEQRPTGLFWQALLTVVDSELNRESARGRMEGVVAALERDRPSDIDRVVAAALLASTPMAAEARRVAALLYELLLPYDGRNVVRANKIHCFGPVSHYLGLLAVTLDRLDDAEQHFEDAIAMNRRMCARVFLAHSVYGLARMLAKRGAVGDDVRARELVDEALGLARLCEMSVLKGRASALQATLAGA
ncbi:MAG TPA: AAA family ATPase [Thermomicrobiales bacterium]|nr:AAA family ATPase [Thermomicrobiales bacterium]